MCHIERRQIHRVFSQLWIEVKNRFKASYLKRNIKFCSRNVVTIYSSKAKLTNKETSILSRLYELESITSRYIILAGGAKADPKTPTGVIIGSKIYGYGSEVLSGVDIVKEKYSGHWVLLTRNRAFTTKFAFVKLLQDYFRIKACPACGQSLQRSYDNLVYLQGIIQFLFAGLGPVQNGESSGQAFDRFYTLNKDLIQERVEAYLKA